MTYPIKISKDGVELYLLEEDRDKINKDDPRFKIEYGDFQV